MYIAPGSSCCWGFYSDLTFSLHRVSLPCRVLYSSPPVRLMKRDEASVSTFPLMSPGFRQVLVLIASFHLTFTVRYLTEVRHMSSKEETCCLFTYIRRLNRPITTPVYARYMYIIAGRN